MSSCVERADLIGVVYRVALRIVDRLITGHRRAPRQAAGNRTPSFPRSPCQHMHPLLAYPALYKYKPPRFAIFDFLEILEKIEKVF